MGVTNLDVFADDGNFVFGTASYRNWWAVISYRRFSGDFYGMPPNRQRLTDRTYKQALSSLGFMLGVPRCTTPTCPRAYPHNLAEHDAKSTELCPACRMGFLTQLHQEIARENEEDSGGSGGPR